MTKRLPEIGVGAVILKEDKILLILRKKNPEANTWSIPGGKVEPFESLEQATIREVKEEVGMDVKVQKLLCTAETINEEKKEHWVSVIYVTEAFDGEPMLMEPDVIADMRWFKLDDLPENIACFTIPALSVLKQWVI